MRDSQWFNLRKQLFEIRKQLPNQGPILELCCSGYACGSVETRKHPPITCDARHVTIEFPHWKHNDLCDDVIYS